RLVSSGSGSDGGSAARGVAVEVGERQAAVDLDLVVDYGVSIPDLAAAVRRNVIGSVERKTGLELTEGHVSVDAIHLPEAVEEVRGAAAAVAGPGDVDVSVEDVVAGAV